MTYVYHCPHCTHEEEFIRPSSQCNLIEICPKCSQTMYKKFFAPIFSIEKGEYSISLGMNSNKSNIDRMKKEYTEKTGSELVEVGDNSSKVSKKQTDYSLPKEIMAKIHE